MTEPPREHADSGGPLLVLTADAAQRSIERPAFTGDDRTLNSSIEMLEDFARTE